MAEREGFEPSEPAKVHLISSQAHSASSGTSPVLDFYLKINEKWPKLGALPGCGAIVTQALVRRLKFPAADPLTLI